jgi:hypothetical protein
MGVPSIDWEAESYPAHADFAVLPCFVAFFLAVRFLLDRFVFEVVTLYTIYIPRRSVSNHFCCCCTPSFVTRGYFVKACNRGANHTCFVPTVWYNYLLLSS